MFWTKFFNYLGATLIVTALVTVATLLFKTATATGKIEYCYINEYISAYPYYVLYGFRDWRQDRIIVSTKTYEESIKYAVAIKCNIGVEQ